MGNATQVSPATIGGALATVLIWLLAPWLASIGREVTPEVGSGVTVLVVALVAYVLPADVLGKVRRRTRPEAER